MVQFSRHRIAHSAEKRVTAQATLLGFMTSWHKACENGVALETLWIALVTFETEAVALKLLELEGRNVLPG